MGYCAVLDVRPEPETYKTQRKGRLLTMKEKLIMKALAAWALVAGLVSLPAGASAAEPALTGQLQGVLNQVVSSSSDHLGVLASIDAPRIHLNWSGAAGTIARNSNVALRPNQPFRIASVTKVFVAAAVFRLIEEGKLSLYDPIIEHISPETAKVLESGGYDPKIISVAQLLGMTSGLGDFGPNPEYLRAVREHWRDHKRWTRLDQIKFTVQYEKKVGDPGERYYYSDTGYIILGEIIQRVSGEQMAAYVRQSLDFAGLHLNSTYWEILEPTPQDSPPRAHQYWGRIDITNLDYTLDLWGGGGIISTTGDLNRFFRALLTGQLFKQRSTLPMSLLPDQPQIPMRRPGALMLDTQKLGSHECYAHWGYWGTVSMYCPDIDVAVTSTIDQDMDDQAHNSYANQMKLLNGLASALDTALHDRQ